MDPKNNSSNNYNYLVSDHDGDEGEEKNKITFLCEN